MGILEKELFNSRFFENWHLHFNKLEAYLQKKKTSQLPVPGDLDEEVLKWLEIQRKIKDKLPAELKEKFTALEADLSEFDNSWDHLYHQLTQFYKESNHLALPDDAKHEVLKDWLLRQIQNKNYLSEEQFNLLDKLGVEWDLTFTRDQRWNLMYARLKEFYLTYGHGQVPQKWEQDKTLANWVRVQRTLKATNKLRPDREAKLNQLNFVWHIQAIYDAQWQQYYQQLLAFYQQHGHCRVPGKFKQLTSWIENQRTNKKNKILLPEREQLLNEIGFIWSFSNIKKNQWNEKYKQLRAFKKKHGHSFVPVNYKEDKALGTWVASQRRLEANGQLGPEKKKKLDQLGFVWHTDTLKQLKSKYDAQWNLNFERLKIYRQVYGTCQVSLKINPVLQRWTRWQRKLFYEGNLSEERLAKLNEIRFPWNVQEGYWMKMYEALAEFKKQFGHTRVPHQWPENQQLAAWVYRMKIAKPELSAQKVELLDLLGFDWKVSRKTVVAWEEMYNRLLQFKQEFGHTRVPVKWSRDPKLGKWVSRMRQEKDKLLPERVNLLNKINFDWGKQFVLGQD